MIDTGYKHIDARYLILIKLKKYDNRQFVTTYQDSRALLY